MIPRLQNGNLKNANELLFGLLLFETFFFSYIFIIFTVLFLHVIIIISNICIHTNGSKLIYICIYIVSVI